MSIESLSALLAAIVSLAIAFGVALRDRVRPTFVSFSYFAFNVGLWHLAAFLHRALRTEFFYWVSLLVALHLPASAVYFFRAFLADETSGGGVVRGVRTPRVLIAGLVLGYAGLAYSAFRGFAALRLFNTAVLVYVFAGLGLCIHWLHRTCRATVSRTHQARLRYLVVGGAAATVLMLLDLASLGRRVYIPAGTIVTVVYLYFLSQTLIRYRLLDLNELLGRMAVLSVLLLVLTAVYALVVSWVRADHPGLFAFNTVVASFVIVTLFDPLRELLEETINRWIFREKADLRRRLEALRRVLANVIDVPQMVSRLMAALDGSRRVTHAALYLLDGSGAGYDLAGHLGPRPVERLEAAARRPLIDRLRQLGAVSLEELEREHASLQAVADQVGMETVDAVACALEEVHASVCVPLKSEERVLGLLALRHEGLREAYSSDEIDLFRGLAAQLAITVSNSQLYEWMKERDRLAALGEMAAGLAHEIRNPLGAIKGAAQYLLPSPDGPAETPPDPREFLGIIVEEANRLNNVVTQFLDYARPHRVELLPTDVGEVVRRTAQLLGQQEVAAGKQIRLADGHQLEEARPLLCRGDADLLCQVFLNLGLNALEVMGPGGELEIGVRAVALSGTDWVEVAFHDQGPGLPASEHQRVFIPFYTTKDKGTGLGLPISQRIVQLHGGRIEIRSRPETGARGSTFAVFLPRAAAEAAGPSPALPSAASTTTTQLIDN